MNSGDVILENQRSRRILKLLAAQRQLHSDSKRFYCCHMFAAIAFPLAGALCPNASALFQVLCVALPIVLGRLFVHWADRLQVQGARVQQYIDAQLFGIDFPCTRYDRGLAARESSSHVRRHGYGDFQGWYPERIGSLPAGPAEYECQEVNVSWTADLAIYVLIADSVLALAASAFAFEAIQKGGSGSFAFVLVTPIIEWALETALDRLRLYAHVAELKSYMKEIDEHDEKATKKAQELIYDYRCLRPLPDWVYWLTKTSEQAKAELRL